MFSLILHVLFILIINTKYKNKQSIIEIIKQRERHVNITFLRVLCKCTIQEI